MDTLIDTFVDTFIDITFCILEQNKGIIVVMATFDASPSDTIGDIYLVSQVI